jgi:hypothetical protein
MRGLDPEQLDGIELLYSRSAAFESFLPVILLPVALQPPHRVSSWALRRGVDEP